MTGAPAIDGVDDTLELPHGPRLALRRRAGSGRPFLLVHGLSSNARTWEAVARRLAEAGHEVVAVDQRGHGRSEQVDDGYTTPQCAADLAALVAQLGFTGERRPVVAGQSWGGNVALDLATRGGVAAVALVDGGWIKLSTRYASFDDCWTALAPPHFDGLRADQLLDYLAGAHPDWSAEGRAGTLANMELLDDGTVRPWLRREHHREIVRSMYEGDPVTLYPRVGVPALLVPAVSSTKNPKDDAKRSAVEEAARVLPDAEIAWYLDADHDLHVEQPDRLAGDLLRLEARVSAA